MLDVGAVAARSGPPVPPPRRPTRPRSRRSRAWSPSGDVPISPTPSRPRWRAPRLDAGARGDQRHLRRRRPGDVRAGRRARLRLRADAHRGTAAGRPRAAALRRRRRRTSRAGSPSGSSRGRGRASTRSRSSIDPGLDFDLGDRRRPRDPAPARRAARARPADLRVALAQGLPRRGARRAPGRSACAAERARVRRRSPRRRSRSPPGPRSSASTTPSALDAMRVAAAIADLRSAPSAWLRSSISAPRRRSRWERRSRPGRSTTAWSRRAPTRRDDARARRAARRASTPGLAVALGRGRDQPLYSHQVEALRDRRSGERDRHQRHRLGQVALASTCRCSTRSPPTRRRARSTSTRPRRSPRTRRASWPSCARRTCARRSTTATRRARSARRSAAARTWS